jgi:hypothetical protein
MHGIPEAFIYLSAADHFLHAGKFEGRAATFVGTKGNDLVVGNAAIDTLTGVELDVIRRGCLRFWGNSNRWSMQRI